MTETPPKTGFEGLVSIANPVDLIQLYTLSRATGCLRIERGTGGAEVGSVWLAHGDIVHAELGSTQGEEALYQLLAWMRGRFSYSPLSSPPATSIEGSWQQVLLEGCRRLDEQSVPWERTDAPTAESEPPPLPPNEPARPRWKAALFLLSKIEGFLGAGLVESPTGRLVASHGGGEIDLATAAAGNTHVVLAERRIRAALQLDDGVEDILITLGRQYHLVRPIDEGESHFLYLLLDRKRSTLASARKQLGEAAKELAVQRGSAAS